MSIEANSLLGIKLISIVSNKSFHRTSTEQKEKRKKIEVAEQQE